jgi:hypothetical protein
MSDDNQRSERPWTETVGGRRVSAQENGSFAVAVSSGSVPLDLSVVPVGTVLVVGAPIGGGTAHLRLSDAGDGHTLRVTHPVRVEVVDGKLGRLECDSGEPRRGDTLFDGRIGELLVRSGTPLLQPDAVVDRARVDGGQLQVGEAKVATLELHGGDVSGQRDRLPPLELHTNGELPDGGPDLVVAADGLTLQVSSRRTVGHLEFADGVSNLTISGSGRSGRNGVEVAVISGRSELTLEGVDLTLEQVDGHLRVDGQGGLIVERGPALTDVELGRQIRVTAKRGAALRRCTGELFVASAQDATVAADPNGTLLLAGVAHNANRRDEPLTGATLRGISLTDDADGRKRLQALEHAAVVEPRVDKLRVRSWRWRLPGAARRLQGGDEASAREVDDAAFFAEELAALVHRKAGSGAIRTKASWAAYRGRHLTSQSFGERLLLGLYRFVGYGQRPGPAALTWLTLAALVALTAGVVGWGDASALAAIDDPSLVELFGVLALSPLFLLRLAGDPALGEISGFADLVVVLARTVIAAPFIFTFIAISRLLRADWRFT